jgi:hypothetical protein
MDGKALPRFLGKGFAELSVLMLLEMLTIARLRRHGWAAAAGNAIRAEQRQSVNYGLVLGLGRAVDAIEMPLLLRHGIV